MRSGKRLASAMLNRCPIVTAPPSHWVCCQFTRLIDWGIPLFGLLSINWRENGGFSALDCAAANGHVDIVRVLARLGGSQLSNTADDFSGMTPLLWAAHAGHWRCIEELCQNYSNLDVMDRNGQTALHIACREHHHDLARVLLEHKCDPNLQEKVMGKTAIHMVAGTGDDQMCELLLSQHADVNIVDNEVPRRQARNCLDGFALLLPDWFAALAGQHTNLRGSTRGPQRTARAVAELQQGASHVARLRLRLYLTLFGGAAGATTSL